jgi:acyl dehydratase
MKGTHMKSHLDFRSLKPGDALPPLTKEPVTKVQLVRYAGSSGDFNPIHTDDATATKSGLPGVIAHGILIMGFVGQAITTWAPKRFLKRFKIRLTNMTFPDDVITVEATVTEKINGPEGLRVLCDTSAKDQNGNIKVSGHFELLVP